VGGVRLKEGVGRIGVRLREEKVLGRCESEGGVDSRIAYRRGDESLRQY
jgi:hypothetical protein